MGGVGTVPGGIKSQKAPDTMKNQEILLLDRLASEAQDWLAARYRVDYQPGLAHDLQALHGRLYRTDALVLPSWLPVTRQMLDFAPRLVVLGRIYDGGDNIDLQACRQRTVRVVQAVSTSARATAEFLLGCLLTLYRSGRAVAAWPPAAGLPGLGREVDDSVVGLLGLSEPAQLLAPMLQVLGARVVGYDPALHRSDPVWRRMGVQPLSLDDLLQTADAVSLQLPFATRYRGLLGERVLATCKPGQLWASVSRLAVFDEQALADAVRQGRIEAIWVDSQPQSQVEIPAALQGLEGLRITPRLAPRTREALLRGSWFLADRLHDMLQARGPGSAPWTAR